MITVMLWRPHGGKGPGHASLAITRPKSDGKGNECAGVITWFPAGNLTESSFSGSRTTEHHAVPKSVFEEMSLFMLGGGVREVFVPNIPQGKRPTTRIKPPSHFCHLLSLSDTDAVVGLDDVSILNWWEKYKLRDDYNLLTRNCSTAVGGALLAGGGSIFAKPPAFSSIVWTPEKVFEWAIQIMVKLEPLNDKLMQARATMKKLVPNIADKDVWDLATWKQKSSIVLAHRYQLLKDIDASLGEYHLLRQEIAKKQGNTPTEMEVAKLGQLIGRICQQLVERPNSARRAAVLQLGGQVLKRLDTVKEAISKKHLEEEHKAKERKDALRKQYDEIMAKRDELSKQATIEQNSLFKKMSTGKTSMEELIKMKGHLRQVFSALGAAEAEADKVARELEKLP